MNRKLFVGNLPYRTTDQELAVLFASAGTVQSAKVITDKDTGKAKGFGFVLMDSEADARRAIEQLNETTLGGRQIHVSEAQEKPREGNGNGRSFNR